MVKEMNEFSFRVILNYLNMKMTSIYPFIELIKN